MAVVSVNLLDDGAGISAPVSSVNQVFTITVLPVNSAPTFTPGEDQTVFEGSGAQTVEGWATGISPGPADESGQTVGFVVTVDRPDLFDVAPAISADGTLTYTVAEGVAGVANVSVVAEDDGGISGGGNDTSERVNFTIAVLSVNKAPTFTIGPDQTVAGEGQAVVIENWVTNITPGPASDAGQAVAFLVEVDRPDLFAIGPTMDANGTLRYTLKEGVVGTAVLSVRAQDDGGIANGGVDTSDAQTALVNIVSPQPPMIEIGPGVRDPYWLQVNTLLDLPVSWTVGPGRTGTVTVSIGPPWASVSGDGNRLTGVPQRGHAGISVIEVTVTDDLGVTATDWITIQLFRPSSMSARWLEELDFGPTRPSLFEWPESRVEEVPISAGKSG